MYVDSARNNLENIFTKVNSTNQTYHLKLVSGEDNKLGTYFINNFKNVFDNVNNDLKNEYSNYFADKMPLTLDDDRNDINVTFIDVDALKKRNFRWVLIRNPFQRLELIIKHRFL